MGRRHISISDQKITNNVNSSETQLPGEQDKHTELSLAHFCILIAMSERENISIPELRHLLPQISTNLEHYSSLHIQNRMDSMIRRGLIARVYDVTPRSARVSRTGILPSNYYKVTDIGKVAVTRRALTLEEIHINSEDFLDSDKRTINDFYKTHLGVGTYDLELKHAMRYFLGVYYEHEGERISPENTISDILASADKAPIYRIRGIALEATHPRRIILDSQDSIDDYFISSLSDRQRHILNIILNSPVSDQPSVYEISESVNVNYFTVEQEIRKIKKLLTKK